MDRLNNDIPFDFVKKCLTCQQIWRIETRFKILEEFEKRRINEKSIDIVMDLANYYNVSFQFIWRIIYNKKFKL